MLLIENLNLDTISLKSSAKSKDDILKEIAGLSMKSGVIKNNSEEEIYSFLKKREEHTSTGIGKGFAIPHCHLSGIEEFIIGVITVPEGIDFDSLDGEKTTLFIFIIAPEEQRNKHIQILSAISAILLEPGRMEEFLAAESGNTIKDIFFSSSQEDDKEIAKNEKCMLQIFVQHEDLFTEVLNLLSSRAEGEIAVIETENAGSYLYKMPLFASFWNGESKTFSRIIVAVLDKTLCNDAIRRINLHAGKMNLKSGILITAQELFYSSGSLDF